jgi:hypothetical protein
MPFEVYGSCVVDCEVRELSLRRKQTQRVELGYLGLGYRWRRSASARM